MESYSQILNFKYFTNNVKLIQIQIWNFLICQTIIWANSKFTNKIIVFKHSISKFEKFIICNNLTIWPYKTLSLYLHPLNIKVKFMGGYWVELLAGLRSRKY